MTRPLSNTLLSVRLGQVQSMLALIDPGVTMLFGAEYLRNEGAGSQIVVVPSDDRFDGGATNVSGPSNVPKVTRQCWSSFEFHIWGNPGTQASGIDNWDDVYSLRSELMEALQDSLGGGTWRALSGTWLAKGDDDGAEGEELMQYGRWYVLRVEILNSITRQAPAVVDVISIPLTLTLNPPPPGN